MWFVVYNVLLVWCVEMQCDEWVMHVEMQCDEWVMHSMMQCVMNGWCMGDAWDVLCEWMNEWMNEWWINERVGNVEWPCAFCCILSVFVIYLCIFSGHFYWRINPIYTPGQLFVVNRTNPTCNKNYRQIPINTNKNITSDITTAVYP